MKVIEMEPGFCLRCGGDDFSISEWRKTSTHVIAFTRPSGYYYQCQDCGFVETRATLFSILPPTKTKMTEQIEELRQVKQERDQFRRELKKEYARLWNRIDWEMVTLVLVNLLLAGAWFITWALTKS